MLKKIAIAAALAATLGPTGIANADGPHRDHWDSRAHQVHKHQGKKWAHNRSHETVVKTHLHRRVVDDRLPLFRMSGLKTDYRGYTLERVVVKVRPSRGYGKMKLVVNGKVVDRARIDGDGIIRLAPRRADVIGREIKTLQLLVDGKVHIKSINMRVSDRRDQRRRGDWHDVGELNDTTAERIARLILSKIDVSRY